MGDYFFEIEGKGTTLDESDGVSGFASQEFLKILHELSIAGLVLEH